MSSSAQTVTVVIPTKDRPRLLQETLSTVLGQQDVEVRVVVVDDGGTLPYPGLLDDARVRVHRNEVSRGVAAARNAGLDLVDTPWVAFVDDDDLWSPRKLRRQLDALAEGGCRWACSAAVSFTDDQILDIATPLPHDDLSGPMLSGNYVPGGGSGVLVSTQLIRQVGGFEIGRAHV